MPTLPIIKTAANRVVSFSDFHTSPVSPDPDPRTCSYTHFDLSTEQLGRTMRYNCWGFTFLPRRFWINSPSDVDHILEDNCVPVADGAIRAGDVVRYRDASGVTTHTGRVWSVDGSGHCTQVRSKWGGMAEYIHNPLDVPSIYGTHLAYFRQVAPLRGTGDLWIKDAPQDNGQQCNVYLWTSPYIMVDAPPYGSPDLNPRFSTENHVWTMVENRSDTAVENVRVRYYWANPTVGFAPSGWNLIPATAGFANPTNPFTVPPYSTVQAPAVQWLPAIAEAHQCLLAVAYVNDDPKDSFNPDPLVYPFDLPWENNVACRNVTVVELFPGKKKQFKVKLVHPFDRPEPVRADITARLTVAPPAPALGFPRQPRPPAITVALDERRVVLQPGPLDEGLFGPVWGRGTGREGVDHELTLARPLLFAEVLRLREKTLAVQDLREVPLTAGRPRELAVELAAPPNAVPGSVFQVHLEQAVRGVPTGGYTFVVIVTKPA